MGAVAASPASSSPSSSSLEHHEKYLFRSLLKAMEVLLRRMAIARVVQIGLYNTTIEDGDRVRITMAKIGYRLTITLIDERQCTRSSNKRFEPE